MREKARLNELVDAEAVKKFNETTPTWEAVCPVCGEKIEGTLANLRAHKCQIK